MEFKIKSNSGQMGNFQLLTTFRYEVQCVPIIDVVCLSVAMCRALTLFHTAESEGMLRLRVSRAIGSLDDQPDSPSPSPPPPRLPPIPVGTREAYHREQQQQQQLQQQQQQQLQQQQQQQQEEVAAAISEGGTAALDAVQPTAVPATPVQIQQAEESASAAEQVKQRGVLPATSKQ